jgi:NAD(P)-dependent dehydrogenase (short-subunit alcohol dehydrogenase family)
MSGHFALLKSNWVSLHDEKASFEGKIVLITGATGGLGLEAAKKIAVLHSSKLIITARTEKKGRIAKNEIEEYMQQHSKANGTLVTSVVVFKLDMSDFKGVRSFIQRILAAESQLNAAILNAGVNRKRWEKSSNGFE